ncbi:MAG: sigma-70 family RNA polymerase sigma factor [Verrucomicrobiota bacterium]
MVEDVQHWIQAWLVERDEGAARELMAALYPRVTQIVRGHLPFRMAEEDLVQEVFVKVFQNLHRYDARRPLENWLSRLALNVCRDHLRARASRPELRWGDLTASEQRAFDVASDERGAADEMAATEARGLLRKVLETLPADDRLVLTLLHLEERSVEEIAELTGWSRARVKVQAFRARGRLRKAMAGLK